MYKEQLEDLQAEREAIFMFSDSEKESWVQQSSSLLNSSPSEVREENSNFMSLDETLVKLRSAEESSDLFSKDDSYTMPSSSPFTHLTSHGDSITMVDVGDKHVTTRIAKACSKVVFPKEVMSAFQARSNGTEIIGPKGPIFETARLAGIMGAKRTSDLIPLCHPLPLDSVHIDIWLEGNVAIIECECKVTHKTGVEMEALVGANIAALTIYDSK